MPKWGRSGAPTQQGQANSTTATKASAEETSSQPRLADLDVELRTSRQRLVDMNRAQEELVGAMQEVQNQHELLSTQNANMQDKMAQIQAEKHSSKTVVDTLSQSLKSCEHDLDIVRAELESLRRRRVLLDLACTQLPPASVEVVRLPLSEMAAEAAGLAQGAHRSLEKQLTEIASSTVEYDRECGVYEAEERALSQELSELKRQHEVLNDVHKGKVDAFEWATREVERLESDRNGLVDQLNESMRALRNAEQAHDMIDSKIHIQRREAHALREMALDEILDVKNTCSRTNRVKQCAALESDKQQKDLLSFASAHAQFISMNGTHQASIQLPNGLLDTGSPEMKRSLQQASQPRSARGLRSDFRDFGQIIVGTARD